jgi:hypothetical protein
MVLLPRMHVQIMCWLPRTLFMCWLLLECITVMHHESNAWQV